MLPDATFSGVSSLGKIFLYLAAVVLAGALAAPQAWELIHRLSPDLFGGFLGKIQGMPFHRYLSRSIQVAAIVLLIPLLRSLRIRSLRSFSLVPNPRPFRDLGIGMAAGLLCMVLMIPSFLRFGVCTLAPDWEPAFLHALPRVAATAVAVALLEEFLFRGVLLGLLRQVMVPSVAVFLAAIPFALLHFFNLPRGGVGGSVGGVAGEGETVIWWSGLSSLSQAVASLPSWPLLLWGVATLFLAGLLLGWLTVRTGSLHAAIGLHGVWILGQQLFNKVSVFQPDLAILLPFIGPSQCSGAVPTGLVPLGSLLLGGFLAAVLLRKRPLPGHA
jgi:membrane protease YdiL (CAAX protease family)